MMRKQLLLALMFLVGICLVKAQIEADTIVTDGLSVDSTMTDEGTDEVDDMDDEDSTDDEPTDSIDTDSHDMFTSADSKEPAVQGPTYDLYTKILDKGHRYRGDKFSRGLFDHLGITVGAGMEQIVKPVDNYAFTPMTTVSVGLVKDFSSLHSLRLLYSFGFGYMKEKDITLKESMVSLDYLFNLTSYYDGYKPDRWLNLSPFIGVGMQNARVGVPYGLAEHAIEGHVGMQLKFFAGHRASFTLEPFVKIAQDTYDVSGDRNWKKYDVIYGGNMLFTYYFKSNLSKKQQKGDFRQDYDESLFYIRDERGKKVKLTGRDLYEAKRKQVTDSKRIAKADSLRYFADGRGASAWRSPLFFEFSGGVSLMESDEFSASETMGTSAAISVGKWFSSFIGVRATGRLSNNKWSESYEGSTEMNPSYKQNLYATYVGGEVDAMFNVFGLKRAYNWQSPAGMTILGGVGYGRLMKYDTPRLECDYVSYNVGAQIWMRLSDDLRLFAEPNYTYYSYKIPYTNVKWNKKFADKQLSVRLGLSVLMNNERSKKLPADVEDSEEGRFCVGLGAGSNLLMRKYKCQSSGSAPLDYNVAAYGSYMFNHLHGVQLNVQFVSNTDNAKVAYYDRNPEYNFTSTRYGQWQRTFYVLFPSLNYKLSLTNLMSGYVPGRRCDLDFLVGPCAALRMGESDKMSEDEHATGGNERVLVNPASFGSYFGLNAGFNLRCRVSKHLGIFAMPMCYYFSDNEIFDTKALTFDHTLLFTVNLGVQYKF